MKIKEIKKFKNKRLCTFIKNNRLKIFIDKDYNIVKRYKINLIDNNKGSYKGSFINNYICKKFKSNQNVNLINIETNKILNSCKYFILSENEYSQFLKREEYNYTWYLRSPSYDNTNYFAYVHTDSSIGYDFADWSLGFIPFFYEKKNKHAN